MTPLNTWGVNSLDNEMIQHAQGLSNTMNQVAGSMGTALLVSISAMAQSLYPNASAIEQAYLGDHLAFTATASIMAMVALAILLLVRERKTDSVPTINNRKVIDYSAGFDGVTVDGSTCGTVLPSDSIVPAAKVMNADPIRARNDANMAQVVILMAENDTGAIPIVDDEGYLTGIVTDGDVSKYLGRNDIMLFDSQCNLLQLFDDTSLKDRLDSLMDLNVMALATKQVVTVEKDTSLDEACRLLGEKRIKKMPVVENGKLVGTLSRRDVIVSLAEEHFAMRFDAL